jgi:hypothetical protein
MMTSLKFVIETDPTPKQIQYLEARLYEFNSQATGIFAVEDNPRRHQNLLLQKELLMPDKGE